MLAENYVKA